MAHRIGVDLGGTKIEGIALAEDGAVVVRRRIPTPAGDYTATVEAVGALVDGIELDAGAGCTVGVATPGAISRRTGLIKNANSTVLNGRPLQRDLGARLARDVRLSNDANCFALSEATDGAAAGNAVVFGVILGRESEAASSFAEASSRAAMRSPASGGTTRYRGRAQTSCRVRVAIAGSAAASRRS